MISKGNRTPLSPEEIDGIPQIDVIARYLSLSKFPCTIQSPFREDNHPSFSLYSKDNKVFYKDFSTGESGSIWKLLSKLWNCDAREVLERVKQEMPASSNIVTRTKAASRNYKSHKILLQCKTRDWQQFDIDYWESYGISLKWLKYADVHPVLYKIVTKGRHTYAFKADKYAYAYVEHKENKVTLKIYQPFNKKGFKWCGNINRSVWSLWTKIPEKGDNLIISSSLKDCLNIMCNLHIPAICLQGEGYLPKEHIMKDLKKRFKRIIVFFDNDYTNPNNPGHNDALKWVKWYDVEMVEIPSEYQSKDPSDLYKNMGREKYLTIMKELLKDKLWAE